MDESFLGINQIKKEEVELKANLHNLMTYLLTAVRRHRVFDEESQFRIR